LLIEGTIISNLLVKTYSISLGCNCFNISGVASTRLIAYEGDEVSFNGVFSNFSLTTVPTNNPLVASAPKIFNFCCFAHIN